MKKQTSKNVWKIVRSSAIVLIIAAMLLGSMATAFATDYSELDEKLFITGSRGSSESTGILGGVYMYNGYESRFNENLKVGDLLHACDNNALTGEVTWTLKDGVLFLQGNGATTRLYEGESPFCGNQYIRTIVVTEGITEVGPGIICKNIPNLELVIVMNASTKFNCSIDAVSDAPKLKGILYGANLAGGISMGVNAGDWARSNMITLFENFRYFTPERMIVLEKVKNENPYAARDAIGMSYDNIVSLMASKITSQPDSVKAILPYKLLTASPQNLGNIKVSYWAENAVIEARNKGIMLANVTDYTKPITREQFAELAVKMYEAQINKTVDWGYSQPFSDTQNIYAYKARNAHIMNGTSSTTFTPAANITREQVATILARIAEKCGQPLAYGSNMFSDEISSWALYGVNSCAASGIMIGVGNGKFGAKGNCTIEQSIVTLVRLSGYIREQCDRWSSWTS